MDGWIDKWTDRRTDGRTDRPADLTLAKPVPECEGDLEALADKPVWEIGDKN